MGQPPHGGERCGEDGRRLLLFPDAGPPGPGGRYWPRCVAAIDFARPVWSGLSVVVRGWRRRPDQGIPEPREFQSAQAGVSVAQAAKRPDEAATLESAASIQQTPLH